MAAAAKVSRVNVSVVLAVFAAVLSWRVSSCAVVSRDVEIGSLCNRRRIGRCKTNNINQYDNSCCRELIFCISFSYLSDSITLQLYAHGTV